MAPKKSSKVDPQVHLRALQQAERELLKSLASKEKKVRVLIEEVKALRELIKATARQVEDYQEVETANSREAQKQVEALEEVVKESSDQLREPATQHAGSVEDTYISLTADSLTRAADIYTNYQLEQLQQKSTWSEDERYLFFEIQNAVKQTINYAQDINPVLQESVQQTYSTLKEVESNQQAIIKESYDPSKAQFNPPKYDTTNPSVSPSFTKPQPVTDYKFSTSLDTSSQKEKKKPLDDVLNKN